MKLQTKLIFAVGAAVLSQTAVAKPSFDLRHEIKDSTSTSDENAEHASRFKFGDTFKINKSWKANLSLETKFKSDDPEEFLTDVYINELEVDMGLTYNLGGGWQLKPGMPINVAYDEPNDNGDRFFYMKKVTYKPQVRIQNTTKFGFGKLKTALRYRHEFADFRHATMGTSENGDTNRVTNEKEFNPQTSKITLTGQFTPKSLKKLYFAWEANYIKSHDDVKKGIANDEDDDFDAGVFLGYRIGNFRPYVEAWNIKGDDAATNRRGNKYRIGLKYYWK